MAMDYSEDQKNAIKNFQAFLEHVSNVMIIKGTAGSGKTTLIKQFSKVCKENGWRFVPLGVWGRSSSSITQITGLPAITVAKYIAVNKRIDEGDEDYEQYDSFFDWFKELHLRIFDRAVEAIQSFFSNEEESNINGDVLIIDESSCLSDRDLATFTDYAINNSDKEIKIVFIGDDCQLPPVAQASKISSALSKEYIESELGLICYPKIIDLVESHRASTGPLYELGQNLRPLAAANGTGAEARHQISNRINNVEILGYGEDAIIEVCKSVYTEKPDDVIFITDSNQDALDWARRLRKAYYPKSFGTLVVGERIRSDSNGVKDVVLKGDEFEVLEIIDSDAGNFYILKVREISRRQEYSGFSVAAMFDRLFDVFTPNREFNIAMYKTPLQDDKEMLGRGLRRRMEEMWNNLGWENEEEGRKVVDITWCRYSYTSTVFSAQGGEWGTVVVKLTTPSRPQNDTARYWYTAATRAKKQILVLLGQ
jgi:energy-coupling factor transporter ATP-binding protein EcfA2